MAWTRKVVDLSHWNKTVDFARLKASGIVGVILKASDGASGADPKFAERVKLARAQALLVGAYHFMQPGPVPRQVANFARRISVVGGVSELLKAEDCEALKSDKRTPSINSTAAHEFLAECEVKFGHKIKFYSYASYLSHPAFLGAHVDTYMGQCDLWIADYRKPPLRAPQRTWASRGVWLWQNSGKGRVPGVIGDCDTDLFSGTDAQLKATWV